MEIFGREISRAAGREQRSAKRESIYCPAAVVDTTAKMLEGSRPVYRAVEPTGPSKCARDQRAGECKAGSDDPQRDT